MKISITAPIYTLIHPTVNKKLSLKFILGKLQSATLIKSGRPKAEAGDKWTMPSEFYH